MPRFIVRVASMLLLLTLIAFGSFAWRWPAEWRLPVRPGGTLNQPDGDASPHQVAPGSSSFGWLLLIGVMSLLFVGWLLVVLLT